MILTRFARGAIARPRRCLALLGVVTCVFAPGLLRLEFRTDGAALHPGGDPVVELTRADRDAFRELESVVLLCAARPGAPAVASAEGLRELKELHRALEELPGVSRGGVRSLANMLDPSPGQSIVEIPDLLTTLPRGEAELALCLQHVARSPHGYGLYLSGDGRTAALYVSLLADQDRAEFVERVAAWIATRTSARFELQLTGPVVAEVALGRAVVRDLARLVPAVVLLVSALVLVALRSIGAVLVSMTKVGLVLVWIFGAMGWAGAPVTIVTTILPVVILTMSVTDELHLLERFRASLASARPRGEALAAAIDELARPLVLKSLTTAVGLLSFTLTPMAALRHFGLFAGLGVAATLLLSFTLVPALCLSLSPRVFAPLGSRWMGTHMPRAAPAFLGTPSAILGVALVAVAAPGILRLESRDAWLENLEPDSPVVRATHAFDEEFWGAYRYDVVLTADELAFFQFPRGLEVVERVAECLRHAPHVGGIVSPLDAYETYARVEGLATPVSALPRDTVRRLSRDLMVIQSRIDLAQYLGADGRTARVRQLVKSADFARTRELEVYLDRELPRVLEHTGVRFHRSGELATAQAVVRSVVGSTVSSTVWTLVGVAALLAWALRSVARAIVCLVPTVSGLVILLGTMGFLSIPLGIATGMFAAVAVGVGDDFGIHVFHAYERARAAGSEHRAALGATLSEAGRSIFWNVVVLAIGLSVLGLSSLPPNRRLGLLLAGATVVCGLMTALLMPWLLERTHRSSPTARAHAPARSVEWERAAARHAGSTSLRR